ncbi:MAG: DNA-directed RNA polymerase subunit beta, partial [Alphaproteobacteria bacterium]|nr:DNA-directed RNA polymerase subunit beta [Alphaproteobacteria bacterium]
MAVIQKLRKSFGKSFLQTPLPNLVEIQKSSFEKFLQADVNPSERKNMGLQNVFKSIFPMKDRDNGTAELEFVEYYLDKPLYTVQECMLRNLTYSRRLKVKLRLTLWDIAEDGKRSLRDIKEQEVFLGDIPEMTERGSFIAAGVERVIVSQMHRSMGVSFDTTREAKMAGNPMAYEARINPERGSWIEFTQSNKGIINLRIDKRSKKLPVTVFLRCLPCEADEKKFAADMYRTDIRGMSNEEILGNFYQKMTLNREKELWVADTASLTDLFDVQGYNLDKFRLPYDVINAKTGEVILEKGKTLNAKSVSKITTKKFARTQDSLVNEYLFDSITDGDNVLFPAGTKLTEDVLKDIDNLNINTISVVIIDNKNISNHICETLLTDTYQTREDALKAICDIMRPGDRPTLEVALREFLKQGFNSTYYDLSEVGRFKLNKRLGLNSGKSEDEELTLSKKDFLATLKMLTKIIDGKEKIDDIDNLSNRRIRPVGELLEQTFRTGMLRIERLVRDALAGATELDSKKPQDVINAKPLTSMISEFLGTSQLSQFMDAYNPLAELEHKRLISALGPGGLNRERAGIDVRDVHPTHYGRLCPIHTPEGANIGLISHLASYARVNKYGFIETPYYVVKDGKITDEMKYLTADEEKGAYIAQGNTPADEKGALKEDFVTARKDGDFVMVPKENVNYIDVAPRKVVSIATGLIPFV